MIVSACVINSVKYQYVIILYYILVHFVISYYTLVLSVTFELTVAT